MALRDEVKEQQIKLKDMTWKQKASYFWDYYKIHTIAAVFLLLIAGIFIRDTVNAKENAFTGVLLNSYAIDAQEPAQEDFAGYAGIDTAVYDCYIDTSSTLSYETMSQMDLAVSQRIIAMAQTKGIDVLVSDSEPFSNYAQSMMFTDLRSELTAEEYAKHEADFYYIDAATVDMNNNETSYDEDGMPQIVDTSIDHSDPSAMEEPVPVGIYLKDSAKLKEWNCYPSAGADEAPIFGFVYSSEKKEASHLFLAYLTE